VRSTNNETRVERNRLQFHQRDDAKIKENEA